MSTRCVRGAGLLALMIVPAVLQAQERQPQTRHPQVREGRGVSFGLANGRAEATCDGCAPGRKGGVAAYVRVGEYVRPNLLLGGEATFWSRTERSTALSVQFFSAVAQWYPITTRGLYVSAGLGLAFYKETERDSLGHGIAYGTSLGAGYDLRVGPMFSFTPYMSYHRSTHCNCYNDIPNGFLMPVNVVQIGLGFTWHGRKSTPAAGQSFQGGG